MNELQRTESSKQSDRVGVSLPGSYAPPTENGTNGLGQKDGSPGIKRSERQWGGGGGEERVGRGTSSWWGPSSSAHPFLSNSSLPPTSAKLLCFCCFRISMKSAC